MLSVQMSMNDPEYIFKHENYPYYNLVLNLQIAAEFSRITTVPLIPTFMSKLDGYTSKLASIYRKKWEVAGRKIWKPMATIDEVCLFIYDVCK